MTIKMTQVKSTSISEIGYKRRTMNIVFKNGKIYEFKRVPRAKFDEFAASTSKGRFFNKQVKDSFPYTELS